MRSSTVLPPPLAEKRAATQLHYLSIISIIHSSSTPCLTPIINYLHLLAYHHLHQSLTFSCTAFTPPFTFNLYTPFHIHSLILNYTDLLHPITPAPNNLSHPSFTSSFTPVLTASFIPIFHSYFYTDPPHPFLRPSSTAPCYTHASHLFPFLF